jgi:hypothetical protein
MGVRSAIALLILVISPVLVYLFWPSDESRIRKLIREEVRAVEEEDIDAFMSGVAFHYQDEYGLSYLLLKRLVEREFRAFSEIGMEYGGLGIDVSDERAMAGMDVRVLADRGVGRGYYWGDFREPVRLELELKKGPAGRWLIISASASHSTGPAPRTR